MITLGIYTLFIPIKVKRWEVENTFIVEDHNNNPVNFTQSATPTTDKDSIALPDSSNFTAPQSSASSPDLNSIPTPSALPTAEPASDFNPSPAPEKTSNLDNAPAAQLTPTPTPTPTVQPAPATAPSPTLTTAQNPITQPTSTPDQSATPTSSIHRKF